MSSQDTTAMTDTKPPPQEPAPVYTPIEWETPRPRQPKPSLLRRLLPGAPSGPSRDVPTTKPASTPPASAGSKPEPTTGTLPTHTSTNSTYAGTTTTTTPTNPLRTRLDALLPPHRTYLTLRRRPFLLLLALTTTLLLALILGLSIGLTHHPSPPASLPLPTSSAIHTGDLTYYAPALGACGWTSSPDDAIAAVSHTIFDAAGNGGTNPNANPLCGLSIRVERDQGDGRGNKSVDVVVVDRCVGCAATDLDLSPSAFGVLADEALGRVVGSWAWLEAE
ncbi:hypothetical protein CONLIGDRAFT_672701 [Coniochaeta ligniaria NRRL 30616]|uniref:RlpA-like protein double-psi beta-barrel domain-containing protein n=1 Tax=Coniochaeta ligniaria NRRL 30616 TaxID=1408157 RepID=A0A1J7IE99_9PEZI|nr:hypothetical protein CONLIGDRAFT_672701 [Coniochaeta ligniaria NRRL 30616]